MARATRSSATQLHSEKDKLPDASASTRTKSSTKKRKRASIADNDNHPPQKQLRSDTAIKEENQLDVDDENPNRSKLHSLQLVADVPIDPSDAQQILDILALIDSQALLDRVFPLPPSDLGEPSTSTTSLSLRALLREPSLHPLRVLRTAVQSLLPVPYHLRSRPSSPAAQQLRFCNLACSLLDQASFHSVPLPLDIDSILSDLPDVSSTTDAKSTPPSSRPDKLAHLNQTKKYALMQRLPSRTWWSSLNSDLVPSDSKPLKDLSTANAELVAILPSPSAPAPAPADQDSVKTSITLASYVPKKPPGYKPKLPGPRRASCGTFLDYGPYTSFAPVFEQDGVEVGRSSMGELFWRWEDRKKRWTDEQVTQQPLAQVVELPQPNGVDKTEKDSMLDDEQSLEGLFSTEQIALLKQALGSLELEAAMHELLERNAKALKRLEELQNRRLSQPGEFTQVEEGSEEWDTAQGILDSLSILVSLRPRSSSFDNAPLIPSPFALHRLQRTLPIAPTQGWYGTLPAEHTTALRDDSTLYVKSTATAIPVPPSAPPAQTPTPTQPASTQATVATATATAQAYPGYPFNYATPYRPGYQYKAGQPSPYYPNAYTAQTSAQAQAASQYYQAQSYSTAGQQQYTYSSWYQYNPPTQSNTSAGGSRKGTPQPSTATATPAVATPSTMPTSYAGFFSAATQTPGQRAVANTVAAATPGGGKAYQPAAGGTWTPPAGAGTTGYVAQTLPPHMRSAVVGQAGAAGAYNASLYQPNYYGTYQATPSPAQS